MIKQYKNYKSFIDNVVKLLQGRKVRYISAKTGNAYNTVEEAVKDNTKYVKDPNYRYLIKEQKVRKPKEYNIPFIKDKKVILTNAGLASGAVLSTNMLDTIAKHAEAAGLPINIAIALAAKESTLGNPTFDKSIYKILNPQRRKIYEWFKNGQHINNGNDIPERELINWTRDELGPYGLTMSYLDTKRKTQELYNAALEASEKYDDGRVKDYEDTYADTNVLFNGFKFYKEHPDLYNPGLPNYLELVNQRAKEIWQSPEIQEWYKQYLTNKKIKSLKQGGQIRKMQTAAGGPLILLGKSQKEVDETNNYNRNKAKRLFKGIMSGKVLPTMSNIGSMLGAAYNGWLDPETTVITGDVPNPGMRNSKDIIRLFRATGTSGKFKPSLDGTQEFAGQWFTDNIRKTLRYASSTFKKAKISKESNPIELQVVEIPASEINKYKASELLKRRTDIEYEPTEDFLIPLDYPRLKYPIEGLTGNLLLDTRLKLPIEKQGGKMNVLEFLKSGSGIHIKKKNRGKFTSYCGGKVTDECIRKAKASGNPTLVKRATFAANARKWKHEKGGKAFVEGVNVLDSNPNAYKYVKKKIKKNLLGGNVYSGLISTGLNAGLDIYSAYKKKEAANEYGKALDKSTEVSQLELYAKYFLEEMEKLNNETLPDGIHSSNAFKSYVAHQRANKRALADAQKLKSLNELEKALLLSLANQQVTSSIINGVSSLGLMLLNAKFSSKGNTNNGAPSTTTGNIANGGSYNAGSWTSPSTSNKTYF